MNADWILSPLTMYAALALGLVLTAYLWVSLKMESALHKKRLSGEIESLHATIEQFRDEMAAAAAADAEDRERAAAAVSGRRSMNMSKRSQVLRMQRRGETPESIAAALDLPRGEVELLLKVQQIGVAPGTAGPAHYPLVDEPGPANRAEWTN